MLEVNTCFDVLMVRSEWAVYQPWMDCTPHLRSCVISEHVKFSELRWVVSDLISVWGSVQEFVRYTGSRHVKTETDRVVPFCRLSKFGGVKWLFANVVRQCVSSVVFMVLFCYRCEGRTGSYVLRLLMSCEMG